MTEEEMDFEEEIKKANRTNSQPLLSEAQRIADNLRGEEIMTHAHAIIERAAAAVFEEIKALRVRLDMLEQELLDSSARLKDGVRDHFRIMGGVKQACDELGHRIDAISPPSKPEQVQVQAAGQPA